MADNQKVLVNLATGLEDSERVTVAFLVATAALNAGKQVGIWLTKEAVRLAIPGFAEGVACEGCPPLPQLIEQFAAGQGELLACPICFNARKLSEDSLAPNARLMGTTPLWEWIGEESPSVFSY
jgi:predicted peroxiredoxin